MVVPYIHLLLAGVLSFAGIVDLVAAAEGLGSSSEGIRLALKSETALRQAEVRPHVAGGHILRRQSLQSKTALDVQRSEPSEHGVRAQPDEPKPQSLAQTREISELVLPKGVGPKGGGIAKRLTAGELERATRKWQAMSNHQKALLWRQALHLEKARIARRRHSLQTESLAQASSERVPQKPRSARRWVQFDNKGYETPGHYWGHPKRMKWHRPRVVSNTWPFTAGNPRHSRPEQPLDRLSHGSSLAQRAERKEGTDYQRGANYSVSAYLQDHFNDGSEYFGPFRLDYTDHTMHLDGWNFVIESPDETPNRGNLVVGEENFAADTTNSFITGKHNTVRGEDVTVMGGENNEADGDHVTTAGGENNLAEGNYAGAFGGFENIASGAFSLVVGGQLNTASGKFAAVAGGKKGLATGIGAAVTGGRGNEAAGKDSGCEGGTDNDCLGNDSVIAGGTGRETSQTLDDELTDFDEMSKLGERSH